MKYENLHGYSAPAFKRLVGVDRDVFRELLSLLEVAAQAKRKSGRPSKLSLADQLLLTLSYWREYRTLFHLAASYGIHESNAQRIVVKVETPLKASGQWELPQHAPPSPSDSTDWEAWVLDASETPIERPKKTNKITIVVNAIPTRLNSSS